MGAVSVVVPTVRTPDDGRNLMSDARACMTCGALIDPSYTGRHRTWHSNMDKRVKDAEEEARRAKRATR